MKSTWLMTVILLINSADLMARELFQSSLTEEEKFELEELELAPVTKANIEQLLALSRKDQGLKELCLFSIERVRYHKESKWLDWGLDVCANSFEPKELVDLVDKWHKEKGHWEGDIAEWLHVPTKKEIKEQIAKMRANHLKRMNEGGTYAHVRSSNFVEDRGIRQKGNGHN